MEKINDQAMAKLGNSAPAKAEKVDKQADSPQPTTSKLLKIYDPAMCCSSGVCGPSVDPVLARFAGTLDAISRQGTVKIERHNLSQQPQAFVDCGQVKALLAKDGIERLPYIFIDDELVFQARYPERDELAGALGITLAAIPPPGLGLATASVNSCCGEGGCC